MSTDEFPWAAAFDGAKGAQVDFGVPTDGTDASAALNAAFAASAAALEPLVLEAGVYTLTSRLIVPSNLKVWLQPGAVIYAPVDTMGNIGLIGNAVPTVYVDNVEIYGGSFVKDSTDRTGRIFSLFGDNNKVIGASIDTYGRNGGAVFMGGNNLEIGHITAVNPADGLGGAGVRILYGDGIYIHDLDIVSNDDIVALSTAKPPTPHSDLSISNVLVERVTGLSTGARVLAVVIDGNEPGGMTSSVTNFVFRDINASSLGDRLLILDNRDSVGEISNGRFENIVIDGSNSLDTQGRAQVTLQSNYGTLSDIVFENTLIKTRADTDPMLEKGNYFNVDMSGLNFAPNDILLTDGEVAENSANGTIVGVLSTNDPFETGPLSYSLLDSAGGRFSLQGANVSVAGPLDYETENTFQVLVRVTDSHGVSHDEALTVSVTDVLGVTITGTSTNNTINATTTVAGEPLPTNEEDTINAGGGHDSVNGLGGNDILNGDAGSDTLFGADGDDTLNGGASGDSLNGGDGNDWLDGGAANDTMNGGAGDDTYILDGTGDVVIEAASGGIDAVQSTVTYRLGANLENLLLAGSGNINGTGNALGNGITGNNGNNILIGLGGADSLDGGAGTDTASYAASSASVAVSLATGNGSGGDAQGDTLANIENLTGSNFGDTLEGSAGNNVLSGGAGIDTVSYEHASGAVTVSLATTSAQNTGGAGTDSLRLFENLTGSGFGDSLTGSNTANVLFGLDGNDAIGGGGGADTIDGGAGDDTLTGGAAADNLTGGSGADRFVFAATSESTAQASDIITDFDHGIDLIDLSAIDANSSQAGNQAFSFAGHTANTVARSVTWSESGGNTIIRADVNGNSTPELTITLIGTDHHLSASDFLL